MSKKKKDLTENIEAVDLDATVEINAEEIKAATEKKASDESGKSEDGETVEEVLEEAEKNAEKEITLDEQLDIQKDKFARLMAEFDNYKRRSAKEYERLISLANRGLMLDIIEVRGDFERALDMADEKHDFTEFLKGMQMLFTKFDENLKKNGLEVFADVNDKFDPELHDAMMQSPSKDVDDGNIVTVYEKGYKLKDSVIKHAKVIVSSGNSDETTEEQ